MRIHPLDPGHNGDCSQTQPSETLTHSSHSHKTLSLGGHGSRKDPCLSGIITQLLPHCCPLPLYYVILTKLSSPLSIQTSMNLGVLPLCQMLARVGWLDLRPEQKASASQEGLEHLAVLLSPSLVPTTCSNWKH